MVRKIYNWIKKKIKWFLIATGILGVVLAAPLILPKPTPIALQLKAPKTAIIDSVNKGVITKYAFYTNKIQREKNEVERTSSSITKKLDNGQYQLTAYTGKNFYRKTDGWYQVEVATTTRTEFEKQMGIVWWKRMFGERAYAATASFFADEDNDRYIAVYDSTAGQAGWDTAHDATTGTLNNNQYSDLAATAAYNAIGQIGRAHV